MKPIWQDMRERPRTYIIAGIVGGLFAALLTFVAGAQSMSEWAEIESAPKNGTVVELWANERGGPFGFYRWDELAARWVSVERSGLSLMNESEGLSLTLRWRPLSSERLADEIAEHERALEKLRALVK